MKGAAVVISIEEVVKARDQGVKLIGGLPDPEKEMLQAYCFITADSVIEEAAKHNADVPSMITNAVRLGLALGLQIKVEEKQVKVR